MNADWQPLVLSFQVAFVATILATTLGIAIGLVLTKRLPGRDLLDAITSAPMVMPPTVLGYYVLVALGRNSAVGRAWEALFGSSIVFTRTGAVVAATLGALPLVIKSARAALEGVDPTLLKAARTLGAGPARTFLTVHLPLAARGLVAGVMLAFARSLGDFGVTLMVAGDIPGETQTAALAIYDMIQAHQERAAAGMVAVLTGTTIFALYAVNKLTAVRREE
ncbi:MAG TPA: molybdate ABC transporter permease subunit [Polyangia bacterium]